MIKKSIALVVSLIFVLGLSACGGSDDDSIPKKSNTTAVTDGTDTAKPVSEAATSTAPAPPATAAPAATTPAPKQ